MRRTTRLLCTALLSALLASGCDEHPSGPGAHTGAASPAPRHSSLAWAPCPWEHDFAKTIGQDRATAFHDGFELSCATLEVPLDHDGAAGKSADGHDRLRIALSRAHRKGAEGTRPLVVNFGGPGVPGLQNAAALALRAKDDLGARFDIIGFDPRGVGQSDPIQCGHDPAQEASRPMLDIRAPGQLAQAKARLAATVKDCETKLGPKLAQFSTYQTAQDIDSIRDALGPDYPGQADQIDYLGYSYGAFLGATYAHLHPKQLRAIVLDSPVDLTKPQAELADEGVKAYEDTFKAFFEWTRTQPSYAGLADSHGFLAQAFMDPGAGPLLAGISALLSSQSRWPALAQGLGALMSTGDSSSLRAADPGPSLANWAVTCDDLPQNGRLDDAAVQRLAASWAQEYPTFGPWTLGYNNEKILGCDSWPTPAHPAEPGSIAAAGGPKPLVVAGETDPATPLAWARPFAEAVGGELLVTTRPGHGHYLNGPPHDCVDKAVTAYLLGSALPAEGTRCAD